MTDPRLRDSAQNFAYYAGEAGAKYERNDARFTEQRVRWAASRLKPAHRVLDVGANDGFLAELLEEGVDYHGFELNAEAVKNAYPHAAGRLRLVNAVTFDYASVAPFDAIVCMEMLEHVPDPEALLRSFLKGLDKRGVLVTTSALGLGEHLEPGNTEHLREWTLPEFVELHVRAGYVVVEAVRLEVYRTEDGARMTTGILAVKRW